MTPGEKKLRDRWFPYDRLAHVAVQRRVLAAKLQEYEDERYRQVAEAVAASAAQMEGWNAGGEYQAIRNLLDQFGDGKVFDATLDARDAKLKQECEARLRELTSQYPPETLTQLSEQLVHAVRAKYHLRAIYIYHRESA